MSELPSEHGAWSSALSTNDFAACLSGGLRPLGFVQGCSVVSWYFSGSFGFYGGGMGPGVGGAYNFIQTDGYTEQFGCPHGGFAGHRFGQNFEQTWLEQSWQGAFVGAMQRLVDEAQRLGAHGVVGVAERAVRHFDIGAFELSLSGTAVAIDGAERPPVPFTTFLAGQKLNKLVEAGFAPVSIVQSFATVGVIASCVTEFQTMGAMSWGGAVPTGEVDQLSRAYTAARMIARDQIRAQLGGDVLHAAHLAADDHEGQFGPQIEASIRGNRVRRFKDYEQLPPPQPVVSLVDR